MLNSIIKFLLGTKSIFSRADCVTAYKNGQKPDFTNTVNSNPLKPGLETYNS